MTKKILAIVGSYRKNGVVDSVVDEVLAYVEKLGAEVQKIYLLDQNISFCTNCRTCTQTEGIHRGKCLLEDDMNSILEKVQKADALILASPVNFGDATAITRKFLERMVCFAYWPWQAKMGPVIRNKKLGKKAILVTATGMPGFLGYFFTRSLKTLNTMANLLSSKVVGKILIGLVKKDHKLTPKQIKKAQSLGEKLMQ